jgi:hypothetical protein
LLGTVVLLAVMVRGCQGRPDESAYPDRSSAKHPTPRPAKSSKSQH